MSSAEEAAQEAVHDVHGDVERFRIHLESHLGVDKPIDEGGAVSRGHFKLEILEIARHGLIEVLTLPHSALDAIDVRLLQIYVLSVGPLHFMADATPVADHLDWRL